MNWQILKLRVLTRYRKIRTQRRKNAEERRVAASKISNDFDRENLQSAWLDKIKAQEPHFPQAQGETAVYATFCGTLANFTFNRSNRAQRFPHYFISNNPAVLNMAEALGWHPVFIDLPISDNPVQSAHQAKIAKALPHRFPDLKKYRYLIYTDDKQYVPFDEIDQMFQDLKIAKAAIAIRESNHVQGNILWQFSDALLQERYRAQSHQMVRFVLRQLENGKTLHTDHIYATGFILRDMAHPKAISLNEAWYEAILECGIECQVSFAFLAQDNPAILPLAPAKRKKYKGKPIAEDAPRSS